jgi:hypothetical protein
MEESGVREAEAVIAGYRPHSLSEQAADFARQVVGKAEPPSAQRARALLFAAARLAAFGISVGLQPEAEVLLAPSVIERFIVAGERTISPATRRTLRSNLRHLARATETHTEPAPSPLPRERAKAPYSEAEIAGYLAAAEA